MQHIPQRYITPCDISSCSDRANESFVETAFMPSRKSEATAKRSTGHVLVTVAGRNPLFDSKRVWMSFVGAPPRMYVRGKCTFEARRRADTISQQMMLASPWVGVTAETALDSFSAGTYSASMSLTFLCRASHAIDQEICRSVVVILHCDPSFGRDLF